ncbi:MAG: sugar-binding domain-containing protein [Verrucomicrobiota bacterium]|jgi:beta-galactosidase/beta-glucuronidase
MGRNSRKRQTGSSNTGFGSVWYRPKVESPALAGGERAFLRFAAANYCADVYPNGRKIGIHIGGSAPFSFEVAKQLTAGE